MSGDFLLFVLPARAVWSGVVASNPSSPYMSISVGSGATGTYGAPLPGNTVVFESTAGARDVGTVRLRSWTSGDATGTTATLNIAETDDVGPQVSAGQQVTVLQEWRLWPVYPRIVNIDNRRFQYFEDYDIPWNGQTREWYPVAVLPPPGVYGLSGGTATAYFVDGSFALAPGASIVTWSWESPTSNELTASGQGTEISPVSFTYSTAGQHLVMLTVTDSNGNTHTAYSWVFVYDPASPGDVAYTDFERWSDSSDFNTGGTTASFTVQGAATVADFPHDALVVLATNRELTTPTASWPERENVLFVGYIRRGSVRQQPANGTVSFEASTVDKLMRNASMFPVRIDDSNGPDDWILGYQLTVDRIASMLWRWRSTLASMAPIVPLNDSTPVYGQDFGPRDLYTALNNELLDSAWSRCVVSTQGVVYHERDVQLMNSTERAALTEEKTLHKGLWVDDLEIEEREEYEQQTNIAKMSGVAYQWGTSVDDAKALFSEAPGDVMEHFGREANSDRHILTTQADLNERCGLLLARGNMHYTSVRGSFLDEGSFDVVPQVIFPANIEPTDNNRGLSWTPDLVPRRMKRSFDSRRASVKVDVEFEPTSTGPAGVTVTFPSNPPDSGDVSWPDWDFNLPEPTWPQPAVPVPGVAGASHYGGGFFWTINSGAAWEERNAGLVMDGATGTYQGYFLDLIWDPWWWVRQATNNPEMSIMLGCGPGFVVRTENAGKVWDDLTPNMDDPDCSSYTGISACPTVADLTFKQMHGDIHHQGRFWVLAEFLDVTSWYSWMYVTEDDGASWVNYPIVSTAVGDCDETYCYGSFLRMEHNTGSEKDITAAGSFDGDAGGSELTLTGVYKSGGGYLNYFDVIVDFGGLVGITGTGVVGVHTCSDPEDCTPSYPPGCCNNGFFDWGGGGYAQIYWSTDDITYNGPLGGDDDWRTTTLSYSWATSAQITDDFRYLKLRATPVFEAGDCDGFNAYIDSVRVSNSAIGAGDPGAGRVLAMDVDTETGGNVYLTFWNGVSGYIELHRYDVSGGVSGFGDGYADYNSLAAATIDQVSDKTYYVVPRSPHFPEVSGFGQYVYLFGRWDDGSVRHLGSSTDGGGTVTPIGDASWTTERAGAFDCWADGQELYVFLNDPVSPALWRSLDGGSSWSSISDLPFSVEFEAMYRFYGGNTAFIIGCNTAYAYMAGWQAYPYEDGWTDATGSPSLPTADGFISAIVWV